MRRSIRPCSRTAPKTALYEAFQTVESTVEAAIARGN